VGVRDQQFTTVRNGVRRFTAECGHEVGADMDYVLAGGADWCSPRCASGVHIEKVGDEPWRAIEPWDVTWHGYRVGARECVEALVSKWPFVSHRDRGNAFLRTTHARSVWVHDWRPVPSMREPTGECPVDGCDEPSLYTLVGFGEGTLIDETSFVVRLDLCEAHGARARRESAGVRRVWPWRWVLRHPLRFVKDLRRG
jgi:hypothetical protein